MMSAKIAPPKTYAEWFDIFEKLKSKTDDAAVLSAMQEGTVEWQSGVAERFAKKLIDTINFRMNAASDRFQKEMNRSNGREGAIVQALLALRREMCFLTKAVNLPAIPEKDRQQYIRLVTEQANNMQSSLEESAKKDRSGKLASIVRNNRVNVF